MGVLHSSGYVWWIERGKLAIGTTSDNGNTVSPPSTASHSIRVYGKEVGQVQRDGSISTDDASCYCENTRSRKRIEH